MARFAKKCTKCGTVDDRKTWSSLDEATRDGAFDGAWTCSSCAWSEFELAEAPAGSEESTAAG